MKKIFLIAAALTVTASAIASTCRVDMVDMHSRRFIKTYLSYDSYDACKEGMKACRKEIRMSGNLGRADCEIVTLRPTPTPTPIPTPIPNPYPNPIPNPYPNPYPTPVPRDVTVTGMMEDRIFEMRGWDASDLYVSCISQIGYVSNVDDLLITVNNNRFKKYHTNGWYSANDICSIIEQEARRSVIPAYTYPIRLVGTLENVPFRIEAHDRASLLVNCGTELRATRLGSTDDITFSLNGAPFERLHTNGWWNTPAMACQAMITAIDARL